MYYTIYKTTNLINGKIYIGCHKTGNINDDYLGSGIILKRSIKKYGRENFVKEILHSFSSLEEMLEMEEKLVNEDFIKESTNYNMTIGGYSGGFYYIKENGLNNIKQQYKIASEKIKNSKEYKEWFGNRVKKGQKRKIEEGEWSHSKTFLGKKHKEESKRKIGKANTENHKGCLNHAYGKCWIFSITLKKNKLIKKSLLEEHIKNGWQQGRKMKF